jgi:hypothetical protein
VGVTLIELVDIGVVALAHKEQIAVGQHRTLGASGRPGCIEQPGIVRQLPRIAGERFPEQPVILGAARRDDAVEAGDRASKRCQRFGQRQGRDQQARTGILGNKFDLARMKPGVCRHPHSPAAQQPNKSSKNSAQFSSDNITRSPGTSPRARKPPASLATRSANSR